MIELTPEDLSRLTELLHEHGGLDGLAQAAAAGAKGGTRARRQQLAHCRCGYFAPHGCPCQGEEGEGTW